MTFINNSSSGKTDNRSSISNRPIISSFANKHQFHNRYADIVSNLQII